MKRENLYLIISIFLFILLVAVIYDRFTLSNELDTLKSNIVQIKEESQKELKEAEAIAQKKIEEANQIAESKVNEAETLKERYQSLVDREEKKLSNYYGNLYRYNSGDNYVNDVGIKKFRIDGSKIFVTIQNNGSNSLKPDFTIYFLNQNGFVTGTYSDMYIFSSVSPGETRISDGTVDFNFGSPVYYALSAKY